MERRVFIVEDELVLRKNLCRMLSRAGYAVRCAGSVANFLSMIRDEPAAGETLILDVGLPDGDGLDAWQAAQRERSDLGAIVMTARDVPEVRERAHAAGALAFFSKPVDLRQLLDAVEQRVSQSSAA